MHRAIAFDHAAERFYIASADRHLDMIGREPTARFGANASRRACDEGRFADQVGIGWIFGHSDLAILRPNAVVDFEQDLRPGGFFSPLQFNLIHLTMCKVNMKSQEP